MIETRKHARICAAVISATMAFAPLGTSTAWAHDETKSPRVVHISTKGSDASASLNLLGKPRQGARTVRVYSMGDGSYVCSPAGLGRKSRCSRN